MDNLRGVVSALDLRVTEDPVGMWGYTWCKR